MKTNSSNRILRYAVFQFAILMIACQPPQSDKAANTPEVNISHDAKDIVTGSNAYEFGAVQVDGNGGAASSYALFTIGNTGNSQLEIGHPQLTSGDIDDFDLIDSTLSPINPSGISTFSIRFDPLSQGTKHAVMTLPNNDDDENPFTFEVSGTGIDTSQPEITLWQGSSSLPNGSGSFDFGFIELDGNNGSASGYSTFAIENSGSRSLSITGVSISGTDAGDFDLDAAMLSTTVLPGAKTSFSVRFDPLSAGDKSAILTIANSDIDESSYVVELTGGGGIPEINIRQHSTALPDGVGSYGFNEFVRADGDGGLAGGNIEFSIENLGTHAVEISGWSISGSDFDMTAPTSTAIGAGGIAAFMVRFDPLTAGEKAATITIISNDPDEGEYTFIVSGIGIWEQVSKKIGENDAVDDHFGNSVSISGDRAIIGNCSLDGGYAVVFSWDGSGWQRQARLTPSDGASGKGFGYSVSISGDFAIVGAAEDDSKATNAGSIYFYQWSGSAWVEQSKLTANDSSAYDLFGSSVCISGDYAIAGAKGGTGIALYTGSAYVYRWNGTAWQFQTKLYASDGSTNSYFGESVGISGSYAIVGAPAGAGRASYSGCAYIYLRSGTTWSQQPKCIANDGANGDYFGQSVSISGNNVLIGAPHHSGNGANSGSAYFFYNDGSGWIPAKKTASDGAEGDYFGMSVCISGEYAIVGSHHGAESRGVAYIFRGSGTNWREQTIIDAADGNGGDCFGNAVSLSGNRAIVGAGNDDDRARDSGSAYFFDNE